MPEIPEQNIIAASMERGEKAGVPPQNLLVAHFLLSNAGDPDVSAVVNEMLGLDKKPE